VGIQTIVRQQEIKIVRYSEYFIEGLSRVIFVGSFQNVAACFEPAMVDASDAGPICPDSPWDD